MGVQTLGQLRDLALAAALGAALGFCYELLRALPEQRGKKASAAFDALFAAISLCAVFRYGMTVMEGQVRLYALAGTAAGEAAYFLCLRRIMRPAAKLLAGIIRGICFAAAFPVRSWIKILIKIIEKEKILFKFVLEWYTIDKDLKRFPNISSSDRRERDGGSTVKWRKTSFVLIFIVLAVIVYAAVNTTSVRSRLREAEQETQSLREEIEQQKQINRQLQEDAKSMGEETQIKAIAREKLGLIENGAVLFYDVGN